MKNRTLLALGCLLFVTLATACGGESQATDSQIPEAAVEAKASKEGYLTVHLEEWQADCPPARTSFDIVDSPDETYALKVHVETTSLWTSIEVSGLQSMTSMYALLQGGNEINVDIEGLEIYDLSRPENSADASQNIVLEIDVIAQKQEDSAVFRIRKENSGTVSYTLSYDDGNTTEEIAKFTNDSNEGNGDNPKTFHLDLNKLPRPINFSDRKQYSGPLFDAHVHLAGSKDIKHTRLNDDRLHISPETADEILTTLSDEQIVGLIGFLPIIHNRFDENDDDSVNRPYQDGTLEVINRPDNIIIPFIHPNSHTGIPPAKDSEKLLEFIDRNITGTTIPVKGIGEIHTSYPQTDSYDSMRLVDQVMLDLYDYAAANDLILMIHPELVDIDDLHRALDHNPNTIFLLHGLIDSGAGGEPIAEHLEDLFMKHQNAYFSVDAALMLGYSLMDSCIHNKEQFMANLRSELFYYRLLASSLAFWKPVIEAHPTRMMWGSDLYYWWHYEPDVLHVIAQFGRDFISNLNTEVQEGFAYRNALQMLNTASK
ncbi:hypothetical protein M1O55_04490 [Dehalococcoidia bacterium]|nr:hypothetical protein [Dehalococcoidia bacterium]